MASISMVVDPTPSVADLLTRLGDIPAQRVLLRPAPGSATELDVVDIEVRENRLCELVDGVLVEKVVGFQESTLSAILMDHLVEFVAEHRLGTVAGADVAIRLMPGLVRIPDICFTSADRTSGRREPRMTIPSLIPDLIVEVLSKRNTAREMKRKLDEYLSTGVRLVWFIDPAARTAVVHQAFEASILLDEKATLDGRDVLPGFSLPLRRLFGGLG